jgi:hypothetical protein
MEPATAANLIAAATIFWLVLSIAALIIVGELNN